MPHRNWTFRIADIIEAIEKILVYIDGMTFDQFAADPKTIDAVIRNLTVVGEAARNVPAEVIDQNPSLPWREMMDMRNVVVHEYFGVDHRVVWKPCRETSLPFSPN